MGNPVLGIVQRQVLQTQLDIVSNTAFTSVGIPFPSLGQGRQFHVRFYLRARQLGAGGFRWRFANLNSSINGYRLQWDPDAGAVIQSNLTSASSQITQTATGTTPNLIEFEFTGSWQSASSAFDLQFGQNASDPNASSVLAGSYAELVAF